MEKHEAHHAAFEDVLGVVNLNVQSFTRTQEQPKIWGKLFPPLCKVNYSIENPETICTTHFLEMTKQSP